MGWPAEQAMAMDLNYIAAARIGRTEMLQAIFGAPDETSSDNPSERKIDFHVSSKDPFAGQDDQQEPIALTPKLFDSAFN